MALCTCTQVNNGTQLAFPHAKAVVQRKVALVASSSNYDADDDVFEVQLPGKALDCALPWEITAQARLLVAKARTGFAH